MADELDAPLGDEQNLSGDADSQILDNQDEPYDGSGIDPVDPEPSPEGDPAPVGLAPEVPAVGSVSPTYLAEKLGLDASRYEGRSEEEVYSDITARIQQAAQLEQEVNSLKPYAQVGWQQLNNQTPQAAPQQPAGEAKPEEAPWWQDRWNPPEVNMQLVEQFIGPDGQIKENTPVEIQAMATQWQAYRSNAAKEFWDNPQQYIYDAVKNSPLIQDLQGEVQNDIHVQNTQHEVDGWVNQNEDWLFAQNNGQVARDYGGQPVLSDYGQKLNNYLGMAAERGIQDPQHRLDFARSYLVRDIQLQDAQAQSQAPAAAAPVNAADALAQRNSEELRQRQPANPAVRAPSHGGSVPSLAGDAPQNMEGLSLEDKLMIAGRKAGLVN